MTHPGYRLVQAVLLAAALAVAGGTPLRAQPNRPAPRTRPAAPPRATPSSAPRTHAVRPRAARPADAAKRPTIRPRPAPPRKKAKDDAEPSDEELLRQLEKDVDEGAEKRTKDRPTSTGGKMLRFIQSMNPNLSAIGSFAGAYFYDHPLEGKGNIVPGGGHDAGKTGFHLQEIELALQAAVDPFFRMDVYLSISTHGVHIEEGFFTTTGLPGGLQLRLGQLFHRFGRFNQKHLHTWTFADAVAPVARLLGSEGLGSLAGEVSWMMPLPWYTLLSVSLTGPTLLDSFVGEGDRKSGFHIRHPGHLAYVFHLAQFFETSTNTGLSVGLSYALGPNNSGGYHLNMTHLFGVDLFFKYRNLKRPYSDIQLTAEGYGRLLQVPEDQLFDWGLYAQTAFRLSKRWWLALRYDMVEIGDSGRLRAFGFAEVSTNPEHPRALDDQRRGSVAVTFQPTHFSQLRLQYNNNWTRRLDAAGGPGDFKLSHEVILQLQGNIGAHGAHPY